MKNTPQSQGYYFPAEWHPHKATWLTWPHKEESWPGKLDSTHKPFAEFVKQLARGEDVYIHVNDETYRQKTMQYLLGNGTDMDRVHYRIVKTNDSWCRDYGPAFLLNQDNDSKAIIDWGYNAWGGKYPPFDLDDVVPTNIGKVLGLEVFHPGIIMEGGSIDVNGAGALLTTTSCLLNPNRNPSLNKDQIETYLMEYYGVYEIFWLGEGIVGDDTDGHIDDITRFVGERKVLTVLEHDSKDENYLPLKENLKQLEKFRFFEGESFEIVTLPMPKPVIYDGQRLPASYANFYIANKIVAVPVFNDPNDDNALSIIASCFPDKEVVGIDSSDIIWGLGSWHCLSQQEPAVLSMPKV